MLRPIPVRPVPNIPQDDSEKSPSGRPPLHPGKKSGPSPFPPTQPKGEAMLGHLGGTMHYSNAMGSGSSPITIFMLTALFLTTCLLAAKKKQMTTSQPRAMGTTGEILLHHQRFDATSPAPVLPSPDMRPARNVYLGYAPFTAASLVSADIGARTGNGIVLWAGRSPGFMVAGHMGQAAGQEGELASLHRSLASEHPHAMRVMYAWERNERWCPALKKISDEVLSVYGLISTVFCPVVATANVTVDIPPVRIKHLTPHLAMTRISAAHLQSSASAGSSSCKCMVSMQHSCPQGDRAIAGRLAPATLGTPAKASKPSDTHYDVNLALFPDLDHFASSLHAHGNVTGSPLKLPFNVHPQTGVGHCDGPICLNYLGSICLNLGTLNICSTW
eukprot:gene7765-1391_t